MFPSARGQPKTVGVGVAECGIGRTKMRTVGRWVFGLVASAIIGLAIGAYFQRPDSPSGGALWGMIAALGIFTCAQLWLDAVS
jgi:hypothetical protein